MTALRRLRVALVGCGAVSRLYYAPALQKLERLGQVQVVALFDPSSENLASIQETFPAALSVRDFDELGRMGLDLAIVASPPQYHARQTIRLLEAGASVLCEKPMALSVPEGEAMLAAAEDAQRVLAIGLVRRFFPAAQAIQYLLSRNMMGSVKSFTFSEGRVFKWPVQSASYFRDNGVLRDIGVHVLDLLIWWWGEPEEIVYEDDAMGGVELNCRIRMRFRQGVTGEVRLSREVRLPNKFSVQGEHGQLCWDIDETDQLQFRFSDSDHSMAEQIHTMRSAPKASNALSPVGVDFQQCFLNQIKNVVAAVRGVERLTVPGEAGLASLRAIEHCYSRPALMDMPWLSEQEALRARELGERL